MANRLYMERSANMIWPCPTSRAQQRQPARGIGTMLQYWLGNARRIHHIMPGLTCSTCREGGLCEDLANSHPLMTHLN